MTFNYAKIFVIFYLLSVIITTANAQSSMTKAVVVVGDLNDPAASRSELDLRDSLDSLIEEGKFSDCPRDTVIYASYNFTSQGDAQMLRKLGVSRSGLPRLLYVEIRGKSPAKILWNKPVSNLRSDLEELLKRLGIEAALDYRYEVPQVAAANGRLTFRVPPGFKPIETRHGLPFLGKERPHRIIGMQRGWPLVGITYSNLALLPSEIRSIQFTLTNDLASGVNVVSSEIATYNGTQWLRVVASSDEIRFETLISSIQGKAVMVTLYMNVAVYDSSVDQIKAIRESLTVVKRD